MISAVDHLHLTTAIELARRGLFSTTPNPRVGCVLVKENRVIGRGWHEQAGGPHAEVNALADATEAVAGCTVYVSLEPCSFSGRTPPCADTLIKAGVGRVVIGMTDPNPRVSGNGIAKLRAAGIAVDIIEHDDALALNRGYALRHQRGWPWLRMKVAISLDGRTGMASGESQWITGLQARADVQYWRARSCAILTGIGTVLQDDPQLTVRDDQYRIAGRLRQPLRVVVDGQLRMPATARLLDGQDHILVAHTTLVQAPGQSRKNITYLACGGPKVELHQLVRELGNRGCNELHIEAGAGLMGALLKAGLWDELLVYVAPRLLGSTGRPLAQLPLTHLSETIGAKIVSSTSIGEDLRLLLVPEQRGELTQQDSNDDE